jgi:hypothetical protein
MKIVTFLVLGLVTGCGNKVSNPDGGAGGSGGSGGGGGGGGSGCTDQCTAGASRCADASNQETCIQMNGCLQWVKSACNAAQVCQPGANDMGPSGGACVSGVPCTCPAGFSCDSNGVCQGGDPTKIPIDVKTVNVSGAITLNGAAPTTNPSCDADPATSKAAVQLIDAARHYSFTLPVPCSSQTFAWSGVVFPGTYSVSVVGQGNMSNLPSQAFLANAALNVSADTQNVALDVKTAAVAGTITLNGVAPTSNSTTCSGNPGASVATVHFADATDGYTFDLDVPCSATDYSWGGSIFPGTYVVTVAGKSGITNLPAAAYTFNKALKVTGALSNQVIAVTTKNVSGTITLNGAMPTPSPSCTNTSPYNKAVVHFYDKTNNYQFDLPLPCMATDFSWSGAVYPGNYTIAVAGIGTYSNLPTQPFVGVTSLAVNGDVTGQTLAVHTQSVSGTVTINGAAPTLTTFCTQTGNGSYTQAVVTLNDKSNNYKFALNVPCSATTLAWSGTVYPGNYDVSVNGQGATYSTLPMQPYVAKHGLSVTGDVTGTALDVKTVNDAGTITLDSAPPATSTPCTNNPNATKAQVTLTDSADGYSFTLPVACSSSTFAWIGAIYPGTYKVMVSGQQVYSNVPTQPFLANAALAATSDVTGQVLDVKTRNVGGTITLNGAMPSTSTSCNPSPTVSKAHVTFSDDADGYSFTVPVTCSSPSFSYMGVVYPGTYSVSVSGVSGYSNLPTESYLGTPRLLVK